jgi:pyridoxal phosphate-dependent aminotransferase EpsN
MAPLSYWMAYQLRFEFAIPIAYQAVFRETVLVVIAARVASFGVLGLFRGWWRSAGIYDLIDLLKASVIASSAIMLLLAVTGDLSRVPRSILVLDWLGSVFLFGGARFGVRILREEWLARQQAAGGTTTLILGGGSAADQLLRHMRLDPNMRLRPVGLLDDDPTKKGIRLHGVRVLGPTVELKRHAIQCRARLLVIAIPSATRPQLRRLVDLCMGTGLDFKIVPSLGELIDGRVRLANLREVRIEDLLGRDPVNLDLSLVTADLRGKAILVTGGAGSIGAELARQIAGYRPRCLILLDQAESALYFAELELRKSRAELNLKVVVADVTDRGAVRDVFYQHRPDYVFHAAAYKHVPMMESNVVQAIRNNVIGTYNVAIEAVAHGAAKFILVSTDKAVRPSSVMGATKRIAERLTLGLPEFCHAETDFRAVRFGNVLGSEGSVIPLFKRQLAAGQPLTVTHPDVTRYFMTIPEAVQLMLQAAALPEAAGRISMLEMGEAIRIVDLAENLIRLAGLEPYRDVQIVFTGLRPGEKLHEELSSDLESSYPTAVSKVRITQVQETDGQSVAEGLLDLISTLGCGDQEVILDRLRTLVPESVAPLRRPTLTPALNGDREADHAGLLHEGQRNGSPGARRIWLSPPHMSGRESSYVAEAFATNWIAPLGPQVDAFEQEFCAAIGAAHGAALSSGTAALHLALQLVGVGAGDEVFVSTLTFAASVNPIRYLGATPVFIDSDRESWNMDPGLLREALAEHARAGRLPRALVLVHLYGQSADIEPILDACNDYGVPVIEDAAEALGATYRDRSPGTFGVFGAFSFNGNKILTTSGGGMLVGDCADAIARARNLASQARDPAPHYEHSTIGYNYRMSNVLAGIGRGQLNVLQQRVAARRRNFEFYRKALGAIPGIEFMPEAPWGRHTRWLSCCTVEPAKFGADREAVREALEAANIEARPVWKPMHLQPAFRQFPVFGGSVGASLFTNGLCLPSGSSMTSTELERVAGVIIDLFENCQRPAARMLSPPDIRIPNRPSPWRPDRKTILPA